jgi:hypothetical protein
MTSKESDKEFWSRVSEFPFAEQDRAQLVRQIDELRAEVERLRAIEQAARNLDAHRDEGYATLVSYLIRLHEALGNAKE